MARDIKGKPKNLTEAMYLHDRGRLEVEGARTREEARAKLAEQFGEDNATDYESMNNDQRRAELERRGLVTDGNKNDLIARLERSDNDELEDDDLADDEFGDEDDEDNDE